MNGSGGGINPPPPTANKRQPPTSPSLSLTGVLRYKPWKILEIKILVGEF